MRSKHNPKGDGVHHFDNERLEQLLSDYRSGTDQLSALSGIVELTQQRALTLIRFRKTSRYRPEDELLSDVNYKLVRSVGKFDPARGTPFTFISALIENTLRTVVTKTRIAASRLVELDEAATEKLTTQPEGRIQEATEDLAVRLKRKMRTCLADPAELQAMRWYTDSFINGAFELRRHQCADAAMTVYELSHERSRELYDLTLLEIRRLTYDDFGPRKPVHPNQLTHTRARWMMRLAPLMTPQEFTKFVHLVRDLSPFVLFMVAPEVRSRRQDRNPQLGRPNVEWVLHGHPQAELLFSRV
jgi:hypothetical protein